MEKEEAPSERTLEEMIGKTVRRVWVGPDNLCLDFEDGLSVEIEADEDELRYRIGGEAA